MWAEARKQERKLRGIMVDHKKRAERRRDYYERSKQDPSQFLQLHGRSAKIHFDHSITPEPTNCMMPWQGDKTNMIDRFDGRAHLDIIPEATNIEEKIENKKEQRQINYERYRILIQNDFIKISEEKFLKTIALEENYGSKSYQQVKAKEDKKKFEKFKAAIGFNYEEGPQPDKANARLSEAKPAEEESDSDSELDLDISVNLASLDPEEIKLLNKHGKPYSLGKEDFVHYLTNDLEEAEESKIAKQEEEEKSLLSGRKSRKERRLLRTRRRIVSIRSSMPSYAAKDDEKEKKEKSSSSSEESDFEPSRNHGKVEFITSFGGDSEEERPVTINHSMAKSRSKLKNLRKEAEKSDDCFGPKLPDNIDRFRSKDFRKDSSSRGRYSPVRKYSYRSRSRSPNRRSRHRRRSYSRSRSNERSGQKRRRRRTKSPINRYKRKGSTSDSSSSDDERGDTKYRSKYRNKRRSSSSEPETKPPTPPPVKRYYGRMKESESSSSDEKDKNNGSARSTSPKESKPSQSSAIKEKLRKKMQAQIKRQFKADKKAETVRRQKQEEERLDREEELREIAIKMRERERAKRQHLREYHSSEDRSRSGSRERTRRRSRSSSSSSRSSHKSPKSSRRSSLKLVDY